jgi:hypothetical protein
MISMHRGATLLAAGCWLAVGACSDTAASSDADAAVGVYSLQTVNGQLLPVIIDQQGSNVAEITQGSVTLDADRSFDDVTLVRFTISGAVSTETDAATGTWSLSGRTVLSTPSGQSGPYEMTWDGADRLTQLFNDVTLVYQR